ncbi:MAG TPA: LysR family transcriptional regulator [Pseudolabrys sp.]|nr:LysR family transcriptional regulator [Pseudolabrys sp.]
MHRRHQPTNIPTEIVRTLVAIAELGSFSKAGDRLNLSQPAISAQVKRLQTVVGGAVFSKTAGGGVDFTPLGKLVLAHARRLLQANDQIMAIGGAARDCQPIRLGLSVFFAERFLELASEEKLPPLYIHCDRSMDLVKGLADGYFDIVFSLMNPQREANTEFAWQEEVVWARRADFVLSPGMPLPLVVWPDDYDELSAVEAVERAGSSYRVAFAAADLQSRMAAVAAGIGLMVLPKRLLRAPLIAASDYYLPKLRQTDAGVEIRRGFEADGLDKLLALLRRLAPRSDAILVRDKPTATATRRNDRGETDARSKLPLA